MPTTGLGFRKFSTFFSIRKRCISMHFDDNTDFVVTSQFVPFRVNIFPLDWMVKICSGI